MKNEAVQPNGRLCFGIFMWYALPFVGRNIYGCIVKCVINNLFYVVTIYPFCGWFLCLVMNWHPIKIVFSKLLAIYIGNVNCTENVPIVLSFRLC